MTGWQCGKRLVASQLAVIPSCCAGGASSEKRRQSFLSSRELANSAVAGKLRARVRKDSMSFDGVINCEAARSGENLEFT